METYVSILEVKNVYSLKDTIERVISISELVPVELESLNKRETKLVHTRKLVIMELF